jgi:hypothetical protein
MLLSVCLNFTFEYVVARLQPAFGHLQNVVFVADPERVLKPRELLHEKCRLTEG